MSAKNPNKKSLRLEPFSNLIHQKGRRKRRGKGWKRKHLKTIQKKEENAECDPFEVLAFFRTVEKLDWFVFNPYTTHFSSTKCDLFEIEIRFEEQFTQIRFEFVWIMLCVALFHVNMCVCVCVCIKHCIIYSVYWHQYQSISNSERSTKECVSQS